MTNKPNESSVPDKLPSPPLIPELENRDTVRDTKPPGSDPIDDPAHAKLLARIEESLDVRFATMQGHLAVAIKDEFGQVARALHQLADRLGEPHELRRQLRAVEVDLEALKARCPQCQNGAHRG